jgi:hypothetical protein
MRELFLLAGAVAVLSAAAAAETSASKEGWTKKTSQGHVRSMTATHSAVVRPAMGGAGASTAHFAGSNNSSYSGGSIASPGLAAGSGVKPLRPIARSRTTVVGASSFAAGPAQGRTSSASAAGPSGTTMTAAAGAPILAGKGRALNGPGIKMGDADTPPGGASTSSNGNDPLSKIVAGIAGIFGDMAKMLGGG